VPIGQLEQWLQYIADDTPEDNDFMKILNKIDKAIPTDSDIWNFIDEINAWVSNPNRKGMFN
jgi:hypothetical protein